MWRYARISEKLHTIFESVKFNFFVNLLTIIDGICIITVIVLDYVMLSLIHRDYLLFKKLVTEGFTQNIPKITAYLNKTVTRAKKIQHDFEIGHIVLSAIILSIISLFVIEIILKLIFIPKIFLKRKLEIFEAIIIVITFCLDLTSIIAKNNLISIISLITLIRLWRIGLVLDGKKIYLKNQNLNFLLFFSFFNK